MCIQADECEAGGLRGALEAFTKGAVEFERCAGTPCFGEGGRGGEGVTIKFAGEQLRAQRCGGVIGMVGRDILPWGGESCGRRFDDKALLPIGGELNFADFARVVFHMCMVA